MGVPYDDLIAQVTSKYGTANTWRASLDSNYNQALIDWNAGDDHAALWDVIEGMADTVQYMVMMLGKGFWGWNGSTYALPTALDRNLACPFITEAAEYELTMSKILQAMYLAEPHQPLIFIAYLEAYKASVWNATFDERYFADLVKRWAIWG